MAVHAIKVQGPGARPIRIRDQGCPHGPVRRLMSPGDLGELLKPFVFLDLFAADGERSGFGWHPHSGIATVTLTFAGDVHYADSTGAKGLLRAGGSEYMQAGGGAWHTGSAVAPGPIRGFQLWLALPPALEGEPPFGVYVQPEAIATHGPMRVILGTYEGVAGIFPAPAPITYLHVHLKDGECWSFVPPAGQDVAFLAVDGGTLHVSGAALRDEIAVFTPGEAPIEMIAEGEVDLVVGSAVAHPHPLVTGSYSVHTTPAALAQGEEGIRIVGRHLRAAGTI